MPCRCVLNAPHEHTFVHNTGGCQITGNQRIKERRAEACGGKTGAVGADAEGKAEEWRGRGRSGAGLSWDNI